MPDSLSPRVEPSIEAPAYFTSSDLSAFASVLDEAIAELERGGAVEETGSRDALRTRLAAVIMLCAGQGERDPDALRRAAIRSLG